MNESPIDDKPLEVGLLAYKVIAWVCIIFFGGCAIGATMARQYGPAWGFIFFVCMGAYMLLSGGRFRLDPQSVTHENAFGLFRFRWDEIKGVEIGASDGSIVLHGDDKRFVIPPPAMWSGPNKPAAYELMKNKLDASGVTPYPSNTAAYKIHKNVRVDRSRS